VQFCVDQRTRSIYTGRTYDVGCRRFTGAEIADFLRQRRNLANGAFDRDRHNAQFLAALLRQLTSAGTFSDPDRLSATFGTLRNYVVMDTRGRNVVNLAWDLRSAVGNVAGVGVPAEPLGNGNLGATATAAGLFKALRDDTVTDWLREHPFAMLRLD
jgi:anionic cell wall polymer biosynthesis LytR-Cps2A-Psr (LCP) family protein